MRTAATLHAQAASPYELPLSDVEGELALPSATSISGAVEQARGAATSTDRDSVARKNWEERLFDWCEGTFQQLRAPGASTSIEGMLKLILKRLGEADESTSYILLSGIIVRVVRQHNANASKLVMLETIAAAV
ncbi:hypothetical protein AB1Y20_017296 [Prymnesium parvum]|uniref:Uncharacterized protein n=1 Tax=Prymnesium parvum TaxID=97485 RepID=A0AB34JL78_PRYPA